MTGEKIKKNPQCLFHQGKQSNPCKNCFAYLDNSKKANCCQQIPLYSYSGKKVAVVWGDVLVNDLDRLKTLIRRLRRAIEPNNQWIVSERGVGYALREPD